MLHVLADEGGRLLLVQLFIIEFQAPGNVNPTFDWSTVDNLQHPPSFTLAYWALTA